MADDNRNASMAVSYVKDLAVAKIIDPTSAAFCAALDWCLAQIETDMGKHVAGIPEEKLPLEVKPEPKIEAKVIPTQELRTDHYCEQHTCPFERKEGKYGPFYSHGLPGGKWHNEGK